MTQPRNSRGGSGSETLFLYGQHAVAAALANPARDCRRLLATANGLRRLGSAAERPGLVVETRSAGELDRLLPADAVHQGLVLEAAHLPERNLDSILGGPDEERLLLALDQIEDPRNLGAILRSAAALGVAGVMLPRHGAAPLGGPCAKAASGAVDLLPIAVLPNLAQALGRAKEAGYWVVGLDGGAELRFERLPSARRRVLVLGAEGRGMRRLTAASCDLTARLAIDPRMESLNVAVAAGIALYLLARSTDEP